MSSTDDRLLASKQAQESRRRRTRKAIVDAAAALMSAKPHPSVSEIATRAGVSRRTVYLYFPTLEQLLLDAALGGISNVPVANALATAKRSTDPIAGVEALAEMMARLSGDTLQSGRALIALTVREPARAGKTGVRPRGYRRIAWIESALEPVRRKLSPRQWQRLVSARGIL